MTILKMITRHKGGELIPAQLKFFSVFLCFSYASDDILPLTTWQLIYIDSKELIGEDGAV
jgi:hypothetical protein